MADRDWDKELAKIDKQLGSLSDDERMDEMSGSRTKSHNPSEQSSRPSPGLSRWLKMSISSSVRRESPRARKISLRRGCV